MRAEVRENLYIGLVIAAAVAVIAGLITIVVFFGGNGSACGATQGIFIPERGGSGSSGYSGGSKGSSGSRGGSYSGGYSGGSRYPSRSTGGTTYYVSKYPASYPRRYTGGHLYVMQNNVWVLDDGELNGGC